MLIDERRGIEEAYTSATTTSDLSVTPERHRDAMILIASGLVMNQNRLGQVLRRLHSEIDTRGRPRPLDGEGIERLAATLPPLYLKTKRDRKGVETRIYGPDLVAAKKLAEQQYLVLFEAFLRRLKEFPIVRAHLTAHLLKREMPDAEAKADAVLMWHMQQKCGACGGTKLATVPGTNRHSAAVCRSCWGIGEREIPCGNDGRWIANFLDDCSRRNLQQISQNLQVLRGRS